MNDDTFGEFHHNFDSTFFLDWSAEFSELNDIQYGIPQGVSGVIKKEDWDKIGGNDPQFAPTSWEDMDLFLRMKNQGYKFVLTSKSMVGHLGARASHRLEENDGKSSQRQIIAERDNAMKFYTKWGGMPTFDEYGTINGLTK